MLDRLRNRENIPILVAGAVLISVLLAWLAPSEATLGDAVKLIYVHAALMWVGFTFLTIGGVTGGGYLLWRRDALINWSYGSSFVGVAFLLVTGILGAVSAKVTWGAVFWAEPRMAMLGRILFAAVIAALAGRISGSKTLGGAADFGLAVIAWVLVIRTERVIHPVSPIFSSDSAAVKVFPLLITAMIAFAGLQVVRYWTMGPRRQS
jgi:hypothetical protein